MERALAQLHRFTTPHPVTPIATLHNSHHYSRLPISSRLRFWLPSHFPPHRHLPSLLLASLRFLPVPPRCPRHSYLPSACISSAVFAGAGGGGHGLGGGSGGDGGGPGGGDGFTTSASGAQALGAEPEDFTLSTSAEDVIFLDVGGMSCGGCASSVKKILESQPHVIHASVNLATETAVVKVSVGPEVNQGAKITKREVGEALAKQLSSCGFKSSVREEPVGG